ncbi:enamine deaminase RidA (YjgF/YER057c/UK114 family) [Rhodococcus sp. 27YEA15]
MVAGAVGRMITMSNRINISSGSEWEPKIGYSRAVRVGNQVAVSGTTAPGDTLADQTRAALETVKAALADAGASLDDVIRTRIYLRDMSQWEQAALVHGEVFGAIRPATTILEVSSLIDSALLIEIEADAVLS